MKKIDVKECHKYLLQIAKVFHEICQKYEIPYYMLGGTQLGAVRHQGFIPWDDDMDFGVPRTHYKTLMNILDKELPANYKVISIYHSKRYSNGFFKIEDTTTLIKEVNVKSIKNGINIDIFPIDFTSSNYGLFSKNWLITQLYKIETYAFADIENTSLVKKIKKTTAKLLLFWANNKTIFKFIDNHLILSDGNYLVNHYGAYEEKEIVDKIIFGCPTLYKFEDTKFYGVERYDDYLRHFYNDYMQLPKGRANHFHIQELYLK